MITFNPRAWYWFIGADASRVWSSAANAYVPATDAGFVAFAAAGNPVSRVGSEAELLEVIAVVAPGLVPLFPSSLIAYAARRRYEKETGGIVINGVNVATDDRSKTMLMGARIAASADPAFATPWVAADGSITQIDAATTIAISNAVLAHVQACFQAYSQVAAGISGAAPTVTTPTQIDAAFAAVA